MGLRAGFSLVELSIVLVLVGLVFSAILVGRQLVETAEMQALLTDTQEYISATKKFREKYGYLPGDMPNASSFWDVGDHDGDGDGLLEDDNLATSPITTEAQVYWEHLSQSGFITAMLDGTATPVANVSVPAIASGLVSNGYFMIEAFEHPGLDYSDTNFSITLDSLSSEGAYYLDSKDDDGLPLSGKRRLNGPCCGVGNANNIYDLSMSSDDQTCESHFAPLIAKNLIGVASDSCF